LLAEIGERNWMLAQVIAHTRGIRKFHRAPGVIPTRRRRH
jgi:hypothetical protein